jgi:tetratricopeptide (TPR) repeat protein
MNPSRSARSLGALFALLTVLAGPASAQSGPAQAPPADADPAARLIRDAVSAMAASDFDEAIAAADSAAAIAPDRSAAQLVVGQAYLSHARDHPNLSAIGKVKKGRAALERAIALDPGNLDARTTLMQFLLQAPGLVGGSRDGARVQAHEIERRNRERGLLARLDVATAVGKAEEIRDVYDDAMPLLRSPGDRRVVLADALLGAVKRVRDKDLRKTLTARVDAALTEDGPTP